MKKINKSKMAVLSIVFIILLTLSTPIFANEFEFVNNLNNGAIQINKDNLDIKINDKSQLKEYIISELEHRPTNMIIKYYGESFEREDAEEIMKQVRQNNGYHQANGGKFWTRISKKADYIEIDYEIEYRTTDEEEEFINTEIEKIINTHITSNMSEFEKVRILHDYLVNNTIYSMDTQGSQYTAYTVLSEGAGVCNGYVLAFMRLMDAVNIETIYISGQGKDVGLHAWNKIKIDDVWYNIDVTWAFPANTHGLHNAYKFFLNSDDRFYKTHTPVIPEGLPMSTDTRYEGKYDNNFAKIEYGANFDYYVSLASGQTKTTAQK